MAGLLPTIPPEMWRFSYLKTPQTQTFEDELPTLSISKNKKKVDFKNSDLSSPTKMATFIIGSQEKETFLVPRELVCRSSPVLNKAFNSETKEGQTQIYEIEDTTPEAFRIFIQWLYIQKVGCMDHAAFFSTIKTSGEVDEHMKDCIPQTTSLLQLWVLAESLLLPQLQNQIMDALHSISQWCLIPFSVNLKYIYDKTAAASPLRRFVTNLLAWSTPSEDYNDHAEFYPKDFFVDLAALFSSAVPPKAATHRRNKTEMTDFYVGDRS